MHWRKQEIIDFELPGAYLRSKSVPCVAAGVDRCPKPVMQHSPSVAYTVIESGGVHLIFANRLAGMANLAETKCHVVPPSLAAITVYQSISEQQHQTHQTSAVDCRRSLFCFQLHVSPSLLTSVAGASRQFRNRL